MTVQVRSAGGVVPREDREVVDEWIARIVGVVGPGAETGDPVEACRTAAEAAEELSAYLWILIRRHQRTA
ncbi:hypothetical protein FKR81_13790 [Lentzea tibetensis]|uniref:Uncharacterized protein n=1 Tax=Lentzea tibetensis TaxID=2591470 RepID=A0A563EW59_9PSEU|nr:hypothetical protein [Lentzea tibetensis]TWP51909.1 hypothetical protein FKR81_13790 [Lentzea tibetensis]